MRRLKQMSPTTTAGYVVMNATAGAAAGAISEDSETDVSNVDRMHHANVRRRAGATHREARGGSCALGSGTCARGREGGFWHVHRGAGRLNITTTSTDTPPPPGRARAHHAGCRWRPCTTA